MQTVETKSSPGLVAYMVLAVVSGWSWIAAIPRAIGRIIAYFLDLVEGIMLSVLWKYQGENIVKFLYKYRHLAHAPADVPSHVKYRSYAVQTDSAVYKDYEKEQLKQVQRKAVVDKLIEDMIPELLNALHAVPQKHEIEIMLSKQLERAQGALEQQQHELKAHGAVVESAVNELDSRMRVVDERLVHTSNALYTNQNNTKDINARVAVLSEKFSSIKSTCTANAGILKQITQSLTQLDAKVANNTRVYAASKRNVAVATEHSDESGSTSPDLHIAESATTIRTANESNNITRSVSFSANHPVISKAANDKSTPRNSSRDFEDKHSNATIERIHAIDALKELEPAPTQEPDAHHGSQMSSIKSHRFSLRREFKRRSLFGKRNE
ncbi:hypothetical protein J3F80_000516 [Coemansia sp. RSA 2526]|nr:hypothetical protein J3F80_000516 [Coemansia sp. RSA 2526]